METNLKKMQSGSYNPLELARITEILCQACKPDYIFLFGTLAGSVPYSDVVAYDLLVVTNEEPRYRWAQAKRYLKLKFQTKHREIPYVNLYVYSRAFIQNHPSPLFCQAKTEGIPLYIDKSTRIDAFKVCNFKISNQEAMVYFETFFPLGGQLLSDANVSLTTNDLRKAALLMAQAMVLFYKMLFFVYHGFETETDDIEILHDRLRTLSVELMLLFDSDKRSAVGTISHMKKMLTTERYRLAFDLRAKQLEEDCMRIGKMRNIVEELCRKRFELYSL